MKRHIIVFYFTPTVPPVDVFVFCFLLFCFFSLLIVSKKGNTLLQLTGFEYLITFLLRRPPTAEPLRRPFPRPADDSRRLPMTSCLICIIMVAEQTTDAADLKIFENRKTEECCNANFFQKKLYLHQIILLINLLQLGRLKSQITFHPFVLLYNNYTLHHSYKKTTTSDREKRLETF